MRRYPFGRFMLQLPDDHAIGEILKAHVLYDRAYAFLLEEISRWRPGGVLLDIGANIGDTAAVFASTTSNPIVCVEGSPGFLEHLRVNAKTLGDQVRVLEGFVIPDSLRHREFAFDSHDGTGNLLVTEGGDATVDTATSLSVTGILAECRLAGEQLALVKTDTDGCDDHLVAAFLEAAPDSVLYFECDSIDRAGTDDSRWAEVFALLGQRDYSVLVFDNYGLPMLAAERDVEQLLSDLTGYVRLQRSLGAVQVHYLDVWAIPRSAESVYVAAAARMRAEFFSA